MKKPWFSVLSFLVILCLLWSGLPVAAERYEWQNGILPQDWESETDAVTITATNILDPINPHANQEARNLYAYLSSLSDTQTYLTGLFDADNTGSQYNKLVAEFGYEPVVYSGCFKVDGSAPVWEDGTVITNTTCEHMEVEATCGVLKEHYDKGNILLVSADSVVPPLCIDILKKNKPERYADGTNGIIELDCTNPDRDMQAYAVWMKFQQETIKVLQALEDSGVKAYMWRPWIEFNYYDFCGVDQEGYDAFIRVYQQTVQMLIDANLSGFLVCFSPGGRYDFIQRNPGNDYVDTYGTTLYLDIGTIDGMAKDYYSSYEWYVRTGKPVGLTEWSCGGFGVRGSSFDMASTLINYYPRITWTNFWSGGTMAPINAGGEGGGNDDGMLYMSSPFALTLDEVQDYRTGVIRAPGVAQLFDTADATGEYVGLEEKLYTAAELRSLGITANAVRALRLNTGYAITFYAGDNGTGKEYRYGFSQKNISADTAEAFTSLRITRLRNVALEKTEICGSVNDEGACRANDGLSTVWRGDAYSAENTAEAGTVWLSRSGRTLPRGTVRAEKRLCGGSAGYVQHGGFCYSVQYGRQKLGDGRSNNR